jgi:hypothetical protein
MERLDHLEVGVVHFFFTNGPRMCRALHHIAVTYMITTPYEGRSEHKEVLLGQ